MTLRKRATARPRAPAPWRHSGQTDQPGRARRGGARHECLHVQVGPVDYGIELRCVQEIRYNDAHAAPAGRAARGWSLVTVRGVQAPVIDLRQRFGMRREPDARAVHLVLQVSGRTVGVLVDAVCDLVRLERKQLRPAPVFDGAMAAWHVNGVGLIGSGEQLRALLLLDIERLLTVVCAGLGHTVLH